MTHSLQKHEAELSKSQIPTFHPAVASLTLWILLSSHSPWWPHPSDCRSQIVFLAECLNHEASTFLRLLLAPWLCTAPRSGQNWRQRKKNGCMSGWMDEWKKTQIHFGLCHV